MTGAEKEALEEELLTVSDEPVAGPPVTHTPVADAAVDDTQSDSDEPSEETPRRKRLTPEDLPPRMRLRQCPKCGNFTSHKEGCEFRYRRDVIGLPVQEDLEYPDVSHLPPTTRALLEAAGFQGWQRVETEVGALNVPIRNNGGDHPLGEAGSSPEAPPVMQTLAVQFPGGPPLTRPCVDCGLLTGTFCDGDETGTLGRDGFICLARNRLPSGDAVHREWNPGQRTPLCSKCDKERGNCHFCLGTSWVQPPPHDDGPQMEEYYTMAKSLSLIHI